MAGPIIALLVIVAISLLIVRVGTMALMMTGLGRDTASFQSYSAFFGVGFTTSEAEQVVNHPLRRRIIRHLILLGNVGLTSALATVIITFLDAERSQIIAILAWLVVGVVGFILLSKIGLVTRVIDFTIRKGLESTGILRVADYDLLLRVQSGYGVCEVEVTEDSFLAGKMLGDSRPADQGLIVLGIHREGVGFHGAPKRHERIQTGDILLVYGHEDALKPHRKPTQPTITK